MVIRHETETPQYPYYNSRDIGKETFCRIGNQLVWQKQDQQPKAEITMPYAQTLTNPYPLADVRLGQLRAGDSDFQVRDFICKIAILEDI